MQYNLVFNDGVSQNNLVFNRHQRGGITIAQNESGLIFDNNKHATKLTGNQFFTGKTTNDFAQMGDIYDLGAAAFSNDYNDLNNKPTIPTLTSQLTNNSGFITNVITALGFTPENVANKVTDLNTPNNTTFPTTQAIINENKKATITVELINLLTTSFYAPNALRINSTALINGSGTIALKVNDVAYTLGNLIAQGAKITVETTTASVYNLIVIYE